MNEPILYQDPDVTITKTRFMVNGAMFAMSGIISVRGRAVEPSRAPLIWGLLFALLCFISLSTWLGLACLFAGFGLQVWLWCRRQYAVVLQTSSGEQVAFQDHSKQRITEIIGALQAGIVERG